MLGRCSGIVFPGRFFICIQVGQTSHIRHRESSTNRLEETNTLHDSYTKGKLLTHLFNAVTIDSELSDIRHQKTDMRQLQTLIQQQRIITLSV